MDKEAVGSCSQITRDLPFSQIVVPYILEDGKLEIPQKLVEEHGIYSSKDLNIDLEDSDDDCSIQILDQWPQSGREVSVCSQSSKEPSASSARDRVIQRAKAFQSPNPNFIFTMRPSYLSYLYVPAGEARCCFCGRSDKSVCLTGPDGRSWSMKYCFYGSRRHQVRTTSGWREFVNGYNLQYGDTCVFDLINTTNLTFNIIIFRINDEEVDKKEPTALERAKSLECKKPSFIVVIKFNIQSLYYLYTLRVPSDHASRYLSDQHEKEVFLQLIAGKTWSVRCTVHGSVVRLSLGWKDFVLDNDLQDGDVCVFELLSQAPSHYIVTIFKKTELTEGLIAQSQLA